MMKKFVFIFMMACGLLFASCKQNVNPVITTTFEIEVSDVTASTADVTITASDTTTWYYFDILPIEYYEEYENSDALAADYITWLEEYVQEEQEYDPTFVFTDLLSRGKDSYDFERLTAETEYVVFVFGIDTATHQKVGAFFHKSFVTDTVETVLLTFENALTDTAIWFLPNDDDIFYFPGLVSSDTLVNYGMTPEEYWINYVAQFGEYVDYFTQNGPIYVSLSELVPDAEYVFLAQARDNGLWVSDLFTTTFEAPVPGNAPMHKLMKKGQFAKKFLKGERMK